MSDESSKPISTRLALELLDEMIMNQRAKTLKMARRINPHLTPDDLMITWDWPELNGNPQFMWEDGILGGLEAAHAAISREFRDADPDYKIRRLHTEGAPAQPSPPSKDTENQ